MKIIFLLIFSCVAGFAFADGSSTGKIKGMTVDQNGVYVSTNGVIASKAGCNITNRFWFSKTSDYSDIFLSVLLTAKATGETITLVGTGGCSTIHASGEAAESLRKICATASPC